MPVKQLRPFTHQDHLTLAHDLAAGAVTASLNAERAAAAGYGVIAGIWAELVVAHHRALEAHEQALRLLAARGEAIPPPWLATAAALAKRTERLGNEAKEASDHAGGRSWG